MTTAIILAGGESSRLRPLGDKSLQRFLGKSLLRRHLETLVDIGITEVVVLTNPRNDDLMRVECAAVPPGVDVQFAQQPEPLGMGDAVARALELVSPDTQVYITQTHDLLDADFHRLALHAAQDEPDSIFIAARHVTSYFPGGYLIPAKSDVAVSERPFVVRGIVEKPGVGHEPSDWVTLVAHIVPRAGGLSAALATAADGDAGDRYERALTMLMERHRVLALPHLAPTASLKYPWHMLDIMDLLLSRLKTSTISPTAMIAEGATVRGPVIIEGGVRIFPGAAVIGPAYLDAGTILGNNALVRDSMIGARSIIGYSTEVARSWIGDNVWFHTNYVGDSVIDSNVSFGSGTVTGNLRLDEGIIKVNIKGERVPTGRNKLGQIIGSGTRIGINASLMPGVVIGRDTFVGPG
ncbi:MAG TPA: NTP transferase domain-containing protein, partial [Ktedonobacterales bacterium]|nr:NTP transferase domain-containing protein [Ktedonobacterales bacterium]